MYTFLREFWQPALLALFVLAIAWGVRFVVYHLVRRVSKTHATYSAAALQFATVVGGLYAMAIYYGIDPTLILAVIAIATAGISLASDNAIGNAIAGATVLAGGKIAVGDQVTVAGETGVVTEIGFNNLTLSSNTIGLVTIPASKVAGEIIVNHTRLPQIDMSIEIPFHNSHDRDSAAETIRDVLKGLSLLDGAKVLHGWSGSGESWVAVVKVADYNKRRQIMSTLSIELSDRLEKDGFPIGAISYVKQV